MSATGQKKGIFGLHRAKTGQSLRQASYSFLFCRDFQGVQAPGASATDQCYEPEAEEKRSSRFQDRNASKGMASEGIDHDFVIWAGECNKL